MADERQVVISTTVDNLRLLDSYVANSYERVAQIIRKNIEISEAITEATDLGSSIDYLLISLTDRVFVLERENAALRYMNTNPGFNAELAFANVRTNIERDIELGKLAVFHLQKIYNLEFFKHETHPDYVYQVCTYFIDLCTRHKVPVSSLWTDLVATFGLVSDEIITKYEAKVNEREEHEI